MEYIICKKHGSLSRGTKLHKIGNWICKGHEPLFYATSQTCYDCAMPNDDGRGLERFALKSEINAILKSRSEEYAEAVARAVEGLEDEEEIREAIASIPDPNAEFFAAVDPKYRKNGIWSYEFQTASFEELTEIKELLG